MLRALCAMTLLSTAPLSSRGSASEPWIADRGDGTYRNPILHADYSDPDAIRVGDDYWMVSSSFGHVPGLPILHSRDLVNWSLVAHALPRLVPEAVFATPQHGNGVWAPSIRHYAGKFWIYYPDPDFGLYLITATDPRGPWSDSLLVKSGKGLIDPCPLWDNDGSVYLIHGWARSRAGIGNRLTLLRLSADGTRVEEDCGVVIDGDKLPHYTTLEGPKLYKRNGWYYVFAPAGGVKPGWQSVFRSRSIRGPYEDRIVLAQGSTPINGPHQGALVDTPTGESWFLHFQDKDAFGRIVHLQPVVWENDWPIIGTHPDAHGKAEPVLTHRKPSVGPALAAGPQLAPQPAAPATSDEFDSPRLGLQWQWQANPRREWQSLDARPGFLRLIAQPVPQENLYHAPHLLLQKFPAPEFTVTAKLDSATAAKDLATGLVVFGYDYAWIGQRDDRLVLSIVRHANETPNVSETIVAKRITQPVFLRVSVNANALCQFSFSLDGVTFSPAGAPFQATVARWVGAKVGLFAASPQPHAVDWDFFRVQPLQP
jgi:beta-xylosidase